MANPLDRTWYNGLVDDDGSGNVGTIWNKVAVDALMDAVDASLTTVVDKSGSPANTQLAIFTDADTVAGNPNLAADMTTGGLLLRGPTGYCYINMKDGTQVPAAQDFRLLNNGAVFSIHALNDLGVSLGNVQISRAGNITPSGIVVLPGGAIEFPTTQIPHAASNRLDDYREVIAWTPTITGTGGSSGVSYSFRASGGFKIGRLVHTTFHMNASWSTLVGDLVIDGFPFANGGGSSAVGTVAQFSGQTTVIGGVSFYVAPGTSRATLFGQPTAGGATVPLNASHMTGGISMIAGLVYLANV